MLEVTEIETWGFKHAIRGMRNPMGSWDKSDSHYVEDWTAGMSHPGYKYFKVGENDLDLMCRLIKASARGNNAHRKFLRQIFISMDVNAPRYWWPEFDQYKIGVTTNSESTMHTLHKNEMTGDLFSVDYGVQLTEEQAKVVKDYLDLAEDLRVRCKSGDETWRTLVQLLPQGFNQLRTVTMNYEVALTMIIQRTGHKLKEWNDFVGILETLPYMEDFLDALKEN